MVACLFARGVYTKELLGDCLQTLGYGALARDMDQVATHIQVQRWGLRVQTGFDPRAVKIPERFSQVRNWKGDLDIGFLDGLKAEYARRILEIAGF